jgi:DNA-binding transcriptional ArsR family regulator
MEIDRKTLKALAADTRLDILKSLGKRRKMPSELSKELNLASSTVVEHLNRLEEAELIRREETGHKWIYYNLTDKGSSLVKPKQPIQFIIVLCLGILFIFSGIYRYFSVGFQYAGEKTLQAPMVANDMRTEEALIESVPATDWLMICLLAVGMLLIVVGFVIRLKKR